MKSMILHRNIAGVPLLEIFPADKKNQLLPTIFFYHGWRSQKELVLTQARKLAAKNFRVIAPDALNHGERKQPVSKVPSLTFWQSIQGNVAEFSLLVHELTKKGLIDPELVAVGGVSMGGMTTAMLLTQHPEIIAGACLMGTPSPLSYRQFIFHHAKRENFFIPDDYFSLMSWLENYDLNSQPEKIAERPVLFWHGTQDPRIPYQEVADFYKKIRQQPYAKKVEFFTGENEGHLVQPELMNLTADFFAKSFEK
ncbi:alpha/beta fold hydrolase [Enterococcus timonensis]|uniref:alpha/beta fold hydrolase n=1 Tax=Enterococcus timonensis TaxID=1852364 RepID=UPI0008D99B5C|nr:alpha/beta fold hydrolase [Enterococcus timonensis]